jgi:hypothetical protein
MIDLPWFPSQRLAADYSVCSRRAKERQAGLAIKTSAMLLWLFARLILLVPGARFLRTSRLIGLHLFFVLALSGRRGGVDVRF